MAGIDAELAAAGGGKVKKPLGKLTQIAGQVVAASAKGLIRQAASSVLGESAVDEISAIVGKSAADLAGAGGKEAAAAAERIYDEQGKALLEKFHNGQRSINEFKAQLGKVLTVLKANGVHSLPLFVLVDELDRCRPNYAVAMLERIKHLFEIDDVVFILATDTSQLQHSVKALYGAEFESARYLLRFFDQTYRFDKDVSVLKFVRRQFSDIDVTKLKAGPNNDPVTFATKAFVMSHLSLRDMEQCTDIIRNCVTVWRSEYPLVLVALVPLVIQQQQRLPVSYIGAKSSLISALGSLSSWQLDFNVFEHSTKKILDGWVLFERIVSMATTFNLPRIIHDNEGSSGAENRVVRDIFSEELTVRFRSGYQSNNAPMSVILDYPALVRSVGRLTPT
jgi:hypothetical protein